MSLRLWRCADGFEDFCLDRRIFPDLGATIIAATYPSGLVPSGRRGSHACRSLIRGEEDKLDRVLAIFYGVLDVKVKDSIAISFFEILPAIVRNVDTRSFGTFPLFF
jgi:hypothetical protein